MTNFYPRPPRGGRHGMDEVTYNHGYFYPRPPRGGRPPLFGTQISASGFLSTPSARRATPRSHSSHAAPRYFYPRPPRGGRPQFTFLRRVKRQHFYPRPPRGGRHPHCCKQVRIYVFLSTPSARRATQHQGHHEAGYGHFYPRPPRGGRRKRRNARRYPTVFLSTPSARRATRAYRNVG